jgi:hypothetical protein
VVYLITPTGGRQKSLNLLAMYIERQTYQGPMTWLVCDDCDPPSFLPHMRCAVEVIRPPWRWGKGDNTQSRSLCALLDRVPDDADVIVMEDDDWYGPNYVQAQVDRLRAYELVGEGPTIYFNPVANRWRRMPRRNATSLCETAMKGAALSLFRKVAKNNRKMIDIRLWQDFRGSKRIFERVNVVGMKGLPGRGGIGVGHSKGFGEPAPPCALRALIGNDAAHYGH